MKSTSCGLWIATIIGVLAIFGPPVGPVWADESEPAHAEEPQAAQTEEPVDIEDSATSAATEATQPVLASGVQSTAPITVDSEKRTKPRSLADLASGIDLNAPKGAGEESIVITNENLHTMGEGAVVSEGSNMGGSSAGSDWFVPPSARGAAPSDADIEAAKREIEKLQAEADAVNKAVEENKALNLYTGGGPQYRAPGQTNPLENQQKDVNQQLADARARLTSMEKAAANAAKSGASGESKTP